MVEDAIEGNLGFGVAPLTGFNNPFGLRDRVESNEKNELIFRFIVRHCAFDAADCRG